MDLKHKISYWTKGKKQNQKIKLRIEGDYIYYDTKYMKQPNISSHVLVDMLGFNKYASVGKTIMSNFGLINRGTFDPYQGYKGGIAEIFAKTFLLKKYGAEADIEAFTLSMFKNYNQFPNEAPFSGVLDLMIHMPIKMPIEVKSKEDREYERIAIHHMYPKDQCVQGANQAMLSHVDKYMMLWVFLTPSVSKLLKSIAKEELWMWGENYAQAAQELGITSDDFRFHSKIFTIDERMIKAYREKGLRLYDEFYKNRRIKKKLFNSAELKEIKAYIADQQLPGTSSQ
jgi:hypothetical protein